MPRQTPAKAAALLRNDRGAVSIEWMLPFLLLVVLGAMLAPQVPGKWDHAPLRLSIAVPEPILRLLP